MSASISIHGVVAVQVRRRSFTAGHACGAFHTLELVGIDEAGNEIVSLSLIGATGGEPIPIFDPRETRTVAPEPEAA